MFGYHYPEHKEDSLVNNEVTKELTEWELKLSERQRKILQLAPSLPEGSLSDTHEELQKEWDKFNQKRFITVVSSFSEVYRAYFFHNLVNKLYDKLGGLYVEGQLDRLNQTVKITLATSVRSLHFSETKEKFDLFFKAFTQRESDVFKAQSKMHGALLKIEIVIEYAMVYRILNQLLDEAREKEKKQEGISLRNG